MVLRNINRKMASEQPAKKKLRITDDTDQDAETDETDFVHLSSDATDLMSLQLCLPTNICSVENVNGHSSVPTNSTSAFVNTSLPSDAAAQLPHSNTSVRVHDSYVLQNNVTQQQLNVPLSFNNIPRSDVRTHLNESESYVQGVTDSSRSFQFYQNASNSAISRLNTLPNTFPSFPISNMYSYMLRPEMQSNYLYDSRNIFSHSNVESPQVLFQGSNNLSVSQASESSHNAEINLFQSCLVKQCLCGISETTLKKPFQSYHCNEPDGTQRIALIKEWPTPIILQFLSNLQLLFDVYLKQNNKGFICPRIMDVCNALVNEEHSIIDQIIELGNIENKIINYLTARVLTSFFIVAKTAVDNTWLTCIVANLSVENDYNKINFSIEIIKRIVEWKDVDIHVLEEDQVNVSTFSEPGVSGVQNRIIEQPENEPVNCAKVMLRDHESFDTSPIKCLIIKNLEIKWPQLVKNIELIITNNLTPSSEYCILNFLALWESIISVKANLSVIDTKPFYAHLEKFVRLLNSNLPSIIWKQLLSLFNEVLCYGSTLALQDLLPEETCELAHLIVRYVKDFRLLDHLPYRRSHIVNSFVGSTYSTHGSSSQPESNSNVDKTLLQKMVLLVLKSVAITVKETRSDSSDSSIGSDDYDFNQDMQLIERSIRDVLKKLDVFIKSSLEYHPESAFTKILIHLFSDQDDYMIESMVCTLDITVGIFYRNSVFPDLITMLNPTYMFIEFLKIVSHDPDVLLDYLVSNETCFLLYLLRFLKYIRRNWSKFVDSCENTVRTDDTGLNSTMTVLIRLRLQITRLVNRQLFPYNITPVLRLLETCESLYEGNELS